MDSAVALPKGPNSFTVKRRLLNLLTAVSLLLCVAVLVLWVPSPPTGAARQTAERGDLLCLSALVAEDMGISYRDSAHVGKLMKNAARWK